MSVLKKQISTPIALIAVSLEIATALLAIFIVVWQGANVGPIEAGTSPTIITVNYSNSIGEINRNLFGQSLEMEGGHLAKINIEPYLSKSKTIGFSNVRFGGSSCESDYDWEAHKKTTDPQNYINWVNYSKSVSGQTPILCINLTSSDYIDKAIRWIDDMAAKGISVTYFEMGNEDIWVMDPETYALKSQNVCAALKAKNKDIKCGINLASSALNDYWNIPVMNGVPDADFVIPHLYSPDSYFDTNYFYYPEPKNYKFTVSSAGKYKLNISSILRDFGSCTPKLSVKVDGLERINTTLTSNWQDYSSQEITLSLGSHTLTISNIGDLYTGPICNKKTVIYFSNIFLSKTDGSSTISVPVWDKSDWTYSFLGATELLRGELKNVSSFTSKPMFITEYNFNYDSFSRYIYSSYLDWKKCDEGDWANCHFGWAPSQYDWRSNLFTGLMMNTIIQESAYNNIAEAAIWSDIASGYWSYSNEDGTKNFPLYYIINNYSQKTGNQLVSYTTNNLRTYKSNSIISGSAPAAINIPYLSIVPTRDISKNKIYLTIINRNQTSGESVTLNFNGFDLTGKISITTISGATLDSHPYKDGTTIIPKIKDINVSKTYTTIIPKHSIVFFEANIFPPK